MKLIFIDANIFLDLYRGKIAQLEVLDNFPTLIAEKNYKVYLTDHLVNEIHRNREVVIKEQLSGFEKYKVNNNFSNIIRSLAVYEELKTQTNQYNAAFDAGIIEIKEKLKSKALRANSLLNQIVEKSILIETSEIDRQKARDRFDFGFPPGKDKSYGDALNWNVLLNNSAVVGKNLYLVTRDSDFLSCLDKKKPNSYLEEEWKDIRGGSVNVFESIADLVSQLERDDVEFKALRRNELLDELKESTSFSQTHSIIAELSPLVGDFNVDDLKKFFTAYYTNSQISMIGSDQDIKDFKTLISENPHYSRELRIGILQEITQDE